MFSSKKMALPSSPKMTPSFLKVGVNKVEPLRPKDHPGIPTKWTSAPSALNVHNLSSAGALIRYLHVAAGFLAKSTWLAAIKAGNYASWPGLTFAHASKYCSSSTKTIKGHLVQSYQGVQSTNPPSAYTIHPPPCHPLTTSLALFQIPDPTNFTFESSPSASSSLTEWAASPSALAVAINTS